MRKITKYILFLALVPLLLGVVSAQTPMLNINDVTVNEGHGEAIFIVSLNDSSAFLVSVEYSTADNTATAGFDYIATWGTLDFAPGETSRTILVPIIDDLLYESEEYFYLELSNPATAIIGDGQGFGVITDNDLQPRLSINDVTVNEGDGVATFTVSLSNPSVYPVFVDYSSADGTATAGIDYQATSGILTFSPGETTKTISVQIYDDLLYEDVENFYLDLSNPTNALIDNDLGIGIIIDNDLPSLTGRIIINEIGLESLGGDHPGEGYIEILSIVLSASGATPIEMEELGLIILGADGQVINISEGFISSGLPAGGTMVLYENGTLEIRDKNGNVKDFDIWGSYAEIYDDSLEWVPYNPDVHDFSFGDTTADPLLINLLQSDVSIDYFTANDPSANTDVDPYGAALDVYSGSWYPPAGSAGDFMSFDGSLTDDLVFERVFIDIGYDLFTYEPGEIDSHTAADWTTSNTPTVGALNPTQVDGAVPDVNDGQTVVFGTDSADILEGKAGPDFLFGKGGDDTLVGGEGDDYLDAGTGDDVIVETDLNTSADIIDGGEGTDTFVFTTVSDVESLELTNSSDVSARLSGLEILDMHDGQAGDSLTITGDTVNALGVSNDHTSSITPDNIPPDYDGKVDIYVRGDAIGTADEVNIQGADWYIAPGTITLGPEVYNIWVNETGGDMAVIAIVLGFAPTATTGVATTVSSSSATLNGMVNAKDSSTTVTFEYGTDTSYGTTVTADQSPVTGNANTAVSKAVSGLAPNTTYHYRVVGVKAGGTTYGADITFTTLPEPVPVSAFSATPTSGTAPLAVTFTDESTGSPTQWMWLFGDGGTSTGQHPDHTYTVPGTYSVTLTATNRFGSDTAVMENSITVLAPPAPTPTPTSAPDGGGESTTAVDRWEENLNAGENATFSFDKLAIYRIVVAAGSDIPDIMVTARKATLPSGIPAPNGTVFKYAELTLYKVTDDAIAGTLIEFTVPLSWLENNGFDPSQVMLLRWHDGEWQELTTEMVKEENGKVSFRAESSGLSLFAIIAVETVALDDGEVPTEEPTAEPTGTPAATPEETESPAITPTPTPQETPLLWAPLLALGAFLFFRKRE